MRKPQQYRYISLGDALERNLEGFTLQLNPEMQLIIGGKNLLEIKIHSPGGDEPQCFLCVFESNCEIFI